MKNMQRYNEDGQPINLLRYTKEKIQQDVIVVDIWESIEYYFADTLNPLINRIRIILILASITGLAFSINYGVVSLESQNHKSMSILSDTHKAELPFTIQKNNFNQT